MSIPFSKVSGLADALASNIKKIVPEVPKIAIILGSGLANSLENSKQFLVKGELSTDTIEYLISNQSLPKFTANGHILRILIVEEKSTKKQCVAICGRKHLYEIRTAEKLDRVLRLPQALALAGVRTFIHTSAVGGISPSDPGSLILVSDHDGGDNLPMGLFSGNEGDDEFGPQFFDCSKMYSVSIDTEILNQYAKKGVLKWHLGPQFETPAQIERLRSQGISGVGMSMLPEVMALQRLKLNSAGNFSSIKNIGIGVVSNPAAGIGGTINHDGVKLKMKKASKKLIKFISEIIKYN